MSHWTLHRSPLFLCGLLAWIAVATAGATPTTLAAEEDEAPETPCIENRSALLALDQKAFDQTLDSGWRPIANRPECRLAAADLIRD